ncbi:hypothetical protein SLG_28720 [Sphingobium sp. SYK-6]|uniref:CmcJ/NvfI family oxidoreductase n=1 Tax=Sphingobium sp. (strain NBRC 103272 / SYK-6) TaxID=627192 RepID=UPI0002277170|nr:CmcJ/NvfI family oxidoreductase [Sphingobium sp. SYK-6]BAK67547.1 hypothetical protein SLG_28720 [Sphingobium sp. SYK-6]
MVSAVTDETRQQAYIDTFVRYSDRTADGGYIEANGQYSFGMEDHDARVRNARLAETSFETHGFTLVPHATDVNFADPEDVKARYYPQISALVRELTGADEVIAFLGILRGGETDRGGGPALSAHVDFNEAALRDWVARLMPDRAAELAGKRLVNINVWRGVKPVRNSPLAVCDARSVEKKDFMLVRLGKSDEPVTPSTPGGLNMAYNPRHEWYYYPDMQPDEALVFRLFDTADPDWKMSGHTAIVDPTSAPGAPKRESFEARTIAIFDR